MRRLDAVLALLTLLAPGCALAPRPAPPLAHPPPPLPGQVLPYDMRGFYKPDRDLLGVTFGGAPLDPTAVDRLSGQLADFTGKVGHRPGIVKMFLGWGEPFPKEAVAAIWRAGGLPLLEWEPTSGSLAEIAAGASDTYAAQLAEGVRDLNLPVLLSFAHEMNGTWYPWGARKPAEFTGAWRHLHQVFLDHGAVTVLWVWSPNITKSSHWVKLRPYYPGDAHVDWVGVDGYYNKANGHDFDAVFGKTLTEIRRITGKPELLAETAVDEDGRKAAEITDLLARVRADPALIGLVWFDLVKEHDWRVDSSPRALAAFQAGLDGFAS